MSEEKGTHDLDTESGTCSTKVMETLTKKGTTVGDVC